MIQNARAKIGKGTSLGHIIAKTPIVLLMRCIGYQRVINKTHRIATQYDYDQSKYVGAITYGIYGVGERCLHDEVVAFTKVTFDVTSCNAFIDSFSKVATNEMNVLTYF